MNPYSPAERIRNYNPIWDRLSTLSFPDDVSVDYKTVVLKALDLHHSLHPLVEGESRQPLCTQISGVRHSKLVRPAEDGSTVVEWLRKGKIDGFAIYAEAPGFGTFGVGPYPKYLTTTLERNSLGRTQRLSSTINDGLETRRSVMTVDPFDILGGKSTIDTEITGRNGKLKGSIHSVVDEEANTIDTVVRNAAGHELRQLSSTYERNMFSPDLLCTRLSKG